MTPAETQAIIDEYGKELDHAIKSLEKHLPFIFEKILFNSPGKEEIEMALDRLKEWENKNKDIIPIPPDTKEREELMIKKFTRLHSIMEQAFKSWNITVRGLAFGSSLPTV